ncbi:MAG: M20 family metallopeptidase, partial [Clostridiales bacterium]|nr:M20 family metallopeptidase [Clostridiales bacterium]
MYKERIDAYFSNREDELVEAVSRLVAIPSTAGPAEPGKPFGAGPAAALAAAVELARRWGLEAADIEGYVAAADLNGRDTALHILGHL